MMKSIQLLVVSLLMILGLNAQEVDKSLAEIVAKNFYHRKYPKESVISKNGTSFTKQITDTYQKDYNGHPSYYITNFEGGGWVVVSAHKSIEPILAYSSTGIIDINAISTVFWDWMNQYDLLIDYKYKPYEKNITKINMKWSDLELDEQTDKGRVTPSSEAKGPLITTHWNQGMALGDVGNYCPGYNSYMPAFSSGDCGRCLAGCGPVAIAQVMNYWGFSEGYFADFNWWDMPPDYLDTREENYLLNQKAVSYLLKRIGDNLESMEYCDDDAPEEDWSGSYFRHSDNPLLEFGFKDQMDLQRNDLGAWDEVWAGRLRHEIDVGRPVLYSAGRHIFVLDGKDGDSHVFHFNLGGGGTGDGWYNFSDGFIIGESDFSHEINHECILYIEPDLESDQNHQNGCIGNGNPQDPDCKVFQARNSISAAGDGTYFQVLNNCEGRFIAGQSITLKPGFHADRGSRFIAKIHSKNTLNYVKSKINESSENMIVDIDDQVRFVSPDQISIYPNPFNNNLIIELPGGSTYYESIEIVSVTGQHIHKVTQGIASITQINTDTWQNGMYIVRITTNEGYMVKKLVKE